jgi:acyl dehydratase
MKSFEDLKVGERWVVGAHTFTADDIKGFALRFDPQLFHIDEEAAKRSHFGALCASGWHTASVWMRLMIEHNRREDKNLRSRGDKIAVFGPSPGFRDLKWIKPVYVDDTITYATEIVDLRPSKSRPEWGIMAIRNTGTNQRGEPVISFVSTSFVGRRSRS